MRNELYADNKDLYKWNKLILHARNHKQRLIWAAMFRPDKKKHGEDWEGPPDVEAAVRDFFLSERQVIEADPMRRDLWRTAVLLDQEGVSHVVVKTDYAWGHQGRKTYVQNLANMYLEPVDRPATLLFLDPDNGMGSSRGGHQVHPKHLPVLLRAARTGDSIAMVQFQHHEKNWMKTRMGEFATALGVDPGKVDPHKYCNMALFIANV